MATKIKSEILEEFTAAANALVNPALMNWKEQGGKVVGYFCSFVPDEIISAAGVLPVRIRATGSKGTEHAEAYITSNSCSFTRNCLNKAFSGEYDFLDGAIWPNSCDQVRRLYDIWKRKMKTPFIQIMSVPRKTEEEQVKWYRDELDILRRNLGEYFSVDITDERLRQEISLSNKRRRLQRDLYNLRKRETPPITGAEVLAVIVAGTAMPKDLYNKLLTELLNEMGGIEVNNHYRARLMVIGSELDDPNYLSVIENVGGLVVTDLLCFGSRILWNDVAEGTDDPLTALARYYVAERPSCPRMHGVSPQRTKLVMDMIREFRVDGVILQCMHEVAPN